MHLKGLRQDRLPIPQPRSAIPARAVKAGKQVDFYATVEVAAQRRIHSGDIVLLNAFGAGFAWGAAVIKFQPGRL